MTMNKFNSKWFSKMGERESYWVLMYYISQGILHSSYAKVDISQRGEIFDNLIDGLHINNKPEPDENKTKASALIMSLCKEAILPDEDFAWLDEKNDRMCYWAWLYINKFPPNSAPVNQNYQGYNSAPQAIKPFQSYNPTPQAIQPFQTYNQVPLTNPIENTVHTQDYGASSASVNPTSTKQRLKEIIHKFDFEFQLDYSYKKQYFENMKTKWSECFQYQKASNWLSKNNEIQIAWAWEHFPQNIFIYRQQPANIKEQYLAIVGAFDTWVGHPAELREIIEKAKRAWSQKKHRDKRGNKKAYNFVISNEAKNMLDDIAKLKDKKLSDTLEEMILNEVERLKASGIYIDDT